VWLMQPEAKTTTRGSLAVSAGALEVLLQYNSGGTVSKVGVLPPL